MINVLAPQRPYQRPYYTNDKPYRQKLLNEKLLYGVPLHFHHGASLLKAPLHGSSNYSSTARVSRVQGQVSAIASKHAKSYSRGQLSFSHSETICSVGATAVAIARSLASQEVGLSPGPFDQGQFGTQGERWAAMFKKGCPINQRSQLSGADRKKLRRALQQQFPQLDEQSTELLLPNKAGDMELAKAPAPSRTCIYLHDRVPIVVNTSGKGDIFPTVFGLWRAPGMLPRVLVKHPFVSTYLVNGADLMLPGVDVTSDFPTFQKGDLLAVCVRGNPAPVAVGVAGMSSGDAATKAAQGLKGKLVEVLQVYGDYLWADLGGKLVPNEGFLSNAVVPPGCSAEALGGDIDEGGEGEETGAAEGGADIDPSTAPERAAGQEPGTGPHSAAAAAATQLQQLSVNASVGGQQAGSPASAPGSSRVPEDMNELLELTLLQALSKAVKDDDLPLSGSVLWAQYMLGCRPAGSTLDVKKSKHKKMYKFLASYGGRGGLLTTKEDKHSGDVMVTAINRTHPLLLEFRPMPKHATAGGGGADNGADGAGADGPGAVSSSGAAAGSSSKGELVIQELWQAGKELRGVLEALGIRSDALFTEKEAGEVAFQYVKHANLEAGAPDERTIVLDVVLCDALFKGLVKKGETYPSHLAKAELRECFLRRCQTRCCISRGDQQVIKKGQSPVLTIAQKKKQGHRITQISGMEAFLVDPQQLASDCQKRFASSTTVNELPGKNQGYEVEIQGHLEGLPQFLSQTYGIPKGYIKAS